MIHTCDICGEGFLRKDQIVSCADHLDASFHVQCFDEAESIDGLACPFCREEQEGGFMSESILAWHFVGDTLRDGSPVPKDGEWLEYKGPLKMCESGLHASVHPFDALIYAPGPILCRVECSGKIIQESDKLVCSRRKIIKRMDATEGLRYFARMQALSVAHLWDCPDVVLEFLMTGENVQAARDAAWAAAQAAARAAAWAAAQDAARAAAWAAARDAAWAAARDEWQSLVYEAFEIKDDG